MVQTNFESREIFDNMKKKISGRKRVFSVVLLAVSRVWTCKGGLGHS